MLSYCKYTFDSVTFSKLYMLMTHKALLVLFFSFLTIQLFSQTQQAIMKDPAWTVLAGYDSKYGTSLSLPGNNTAMVVNIPNADFAVLNINDKLIEQWVSPLKGYPLAIGKYKEDILVIAASDKSFFKTFGGSYKAYLLDKITGKILMEKVIYEGNNDFIEQPDFFFGSDGSYFRMSVRLTAMKRKVYIFGVSTSDKAYRETQGLKIINFDKQFNQIQKITPVFPDGEAWTSSNGLDGGVFIAAVSRSSGVINAATYTSSDAQPLKTISIPLDLKKGSTVQSISSTAGAKPFINYLAVIYTDQNKETALLTIKINFASGTFESAKEAFDSQHVKMLNKSFQAVNNKFDNLQFSKIEFLAIKHIEEFGEHLLVSVSPVFTAGGYASSGRFDGSVLMNVYDPHLKQIYHQFIPRTYMSFIGEGSNMAYSLSSNTLRIIANMKTGPLSSVSSLYAEMDFNTGQMLKMSEIPGNDIKSGFYVNTESVSWLSGSYILPYFDKQRVLRTTKDVQLQVLSYK